MPPAPESSPARPLGARLRPLWRWSERALIALVAAGAGLAFGLRDAAVPWTSLVFYATPLPLLSLGALSGVALAALLRNSKRALTWAVLACLLASATFQSEVFRPSAPPGPSADPLRALAWNLHGGRGGRDAILSALSEFDGDLLCLSEVGHAGDRQRSFLRDLEGQLRARGYLVQAWPAARLIVALRASEGELHKQTWDTVPGVARVLWTEARWRGRPLRVALADFRSAPTLDRSPGTELLLTRLESGPRPWLCVGDFNTPRASRCFDPWRESGALHAFEAAGEGYAPTWPAPLPVLTLDHIWSRGLVPSEASAPLRPESDHCPLLVTLGWPLSGS